MVFLGVKKFQPTRLVNEPKSTVEKEPAVEVSETKNVIDSVVETTFIEDVGQEFTLGHIGHDMADGVEDGRNETESQREDPCSAREEKPRDQAAEDHKATAKSEQERAHSHQSDLDAPTYPSLAIETVVNDEVTEELDAHLSAEEAISCNKEDKVAVRFGRIRRFRAKKFFKTKSKHTHVQLPTLTQETILPTSPAILPTSPAILPTFQDLAIEGGVGKEVEVVAVSKHSVMDGLERSVIDGMNDTWCHETKFQPKCFSKSKPTGIDSQPTRPIDEIVAAPKTTPELEVKVDKTENVVDEGAIDHNSAIEKKNDDCAGEARPNGETRSLSTSEQFAPEPNEVFEVVLKGTYVGEHLCINKKQDATFVKRTNSKTDNKPSTAFPSPCLKNKASDVDPEIVADKHITLEQEGGSVVDSELNQANHVVSAGTAHGSEPRSPREDVGTAEDNDETSRKESLQASGTKSTSQTNETARNMIVDSILFNLAKAEVAAKADGDVDAQVKIHLLRAKILRITRTRDEWAAKVDGIGGDDEPDEVFLSGPFKRLLSPVLENLEKAVNILDRAILSGTTGVIMSTANLFDHPCICNEHEVAARDSGSVNSIVDSEIQSIFTA
ncbi:hypothetical protein ACHAW6_011569 [Cyclotella cf. meneghiniana]